ncbi:hypothetical protein BHM03_00061066 [Ensete ventricosum]|uniref:Uncharacterized protein n=1 Tax=Ensete ventricosum TaxID=4639 RepID=A0A445MMT5_ENSVE|nr:hypothetical protein BHM03_00061066 [Ensete ventricosum]
MIVAAEGGRRHAYAALMYMGTRRDYKFYVVTRVMMRSLARLGVDADLVVIASADNESRPQNTDPTAHNRCPGELCSVVRTGYSSCFLRFLATPSIWAQDLTCHPLTLINRRVDFLYVMLLPLLVLEINQIGRPNTRNLCPVISYTALDMSMKEEDGVKVVTVENLKNPYEEQGNFNPRFKLTMNKQRPMTEL